MSKEKKLIAIFEKHPVRRDWSEGEEKWFFSVVDIVAILTGSSIPKRYWTDLKKKLKEEGSQVYEKIVQLKLTARDGKKYLTDVADIETIFRIIQSVPSPKAEPLKLWLAKVGYERMQETIDPEMAISRGRKNWKMMGRSDKWIQQRMLGVETRNKLTDYWSDHGIEDKNEFAQLTNIIHKEWSDLSVKEHKNIKKLKNHNLRDHMNEAELIFTALAELSARQISEKEKAEGYRQNEGAARKGGKISGDARKALENQTKNKVVNSGNFLHNKEGIKKIKK